MNSCWIVDNHSNFDSSYKIGMDTGMDNVQFLKNGYEEMSIYTKFILFFSMTHIWFLFYFYNY